MNVDELMRIFDGNKFSGNKIILKSRLHDAVKFAKENFLFSMLKEIIAVDAGEGQTELTYHLYSPEDDEKLLFCITVNKEAETISDLFKSAIADEREIYDLFGVKFSGHENLKRLYMPEDWKGYPLRKDYIQDDSRLVWNGSYNA